MNTHPKPKKNWTRRIAALAAAAALCTGTVMAVETVTTVDSASAADKAGQNLPTLKAGASGQKVKGLQIVLNAHDAKLDVDGAFGKNTTAAVKDFQKKKGLDADGVVGPKTWGALVSVTRSGDKGADAKSVQQLLRHHGIKVDADGKFGPKTAEGVKSFQKKKKLSADGVVGPATWEALITGKAGSGGGGGGGKGENPKTSGKYANGKLPDSILCSLDWSPKDKVACYVVDEFNALNKAYRAHFGENIQITNPGNGNAYRTYARQVELYNRYGPGRAAKPGRSNHGWGLAIDIANTGGHGGKRYNWLNANAPKYGFDDTVSHEAWHWEWVGK